MNHPLRSERTRQGLSIVELGAAADVNEKSIRRAESWQPVSAETKAALAGALGLAVAAIWPTVEIGSVISGVDGGARIAGRTFDGNYVLQPLEFGPPLEVSEAALGQVGRSGVARA